MNSWLIFWIAVVVVSFISFTYMSLKMLYKGLPELRNMFRQLKERKTRATADSE